MEKYLGNKSSLLPLIEGFFNTHIPDANSLSDVFAGTNNVSRYFRGRGWRTASCDANRFSYVLAQAYLGTEEPPSFLQVRSRRTNTFRIRQLQHEHSRSMARFGDLYLPGSSVDASFRELSSFANVLAKLQLIGEGNTSSGVITDCFTQWGTRSAYLSKRGTAGMRNYFSKKNALFLDGVLLAIREWWMSGQLNRNELFLLMTSVIEEVVITANVNGTFHDFNRDRIWPNAEQDFQLRLPLLSCSVPSAEIANADAIDAAKTFAHHDIAYLDPPYNFRQYSAYYHFLNFIAAYPFLSDIESYIDGLSHVRGQHPDDDFASDFCYQSKFISSLRSLIENIDAEHVVLSYYGGRNHWNHWSAVEAPTDEGLEKLRALFEDTRLFSYSEIVPALEVRKNYQSRSGEQKDFVNEYLFHGVRRKDIGHPKESVVPSLASNVRWGLCDEFGYKTPTAQNRINESVRAAG